MEKHQVGRWTITLYESGVAEFRGPRNRTLSLYPYEDEEQREATLSALPRYVRERLVREVS